MAQALVLISGPEIARYGFPQGHPFGTDRHVRISYAASMSDLERGLDRLHHFIAELQ